MRGFGSRALADALGGSTGGWYFWRAGLLALGVAVERSLDREQSFGSYPVGELRRLRVDVDEALGLLELAVAVQEAIGADEDGGELERAGAIVEVLVERVRAARAQAARVS